MYIYYTAVKIGLKQGVAFRRCGLPAGSGRPPALSGLLQSEGVGGLKIPFKYSDSCITNELIFSNMHDNQNLI